MKTLFKNGTIVPGAAETDSLCTCMIIEDDRIVYVGNDEPTSLSDYKVIDLGGKKILPGFIDGYPSSFPYFSSPYFPSPYFPSPPPYSPTITK